MGYEPVPAQKGAVPGYWELQITPEQEKRFLQRFGDNNIGPNSGHSNRLVLAHRTIL